MKLTSCKWQPSLPRDIYALMVLFRGFKSTIARTVQRDDPSQSRHLGDYYRKAMAERVLPVCDSGVPLADLFQHSPDFQALLDIPAISGAIQSLLGEDQYLIITSCTSRFLQASDVEWACQIRRNTIIRIRPSILRWHSISSCFTSAGGDRAHGWDPILPGSHLRVVSEAAISRYQNIVGQQHVVCPAERCSYFIKGFGTGRLESE